MRVLLIEDDQALSLGVPALPSVTLASLMLTVGPAGASSLTMVTTPWASAMVTPTGVDRLMKKVSLPSCTVSPLIVKLRVRVVWPAVKVMMPELLT